MKWLIVVVALLVSACASTKPTDNYIRVTGNGSTSKIAREDAFQKAIEISVGSLVLSDFTAVNNQLIRKELGSHSAGYVTDFKVISEDVSYGTVTVTMDVLVHTSRIHERLLSASNTDKKVNGETMYEQYRSYNQSKETASKILNQVLNDYPMKAFNVANPKISCGQGTSGTYCFKLDKFGNAIIEVPYEVRWNYNFLRALSEALSYVSDPGDRGEKFTVISKPPNSFIGSTVHYNFNDVNRLKEIKMRFMGTVYIQASVLDDRGNTLFNSCTDVYSVPHIEYSGFIIRGNDYTSDRLHIKIDKSEKISKAQKVELSITRYRC
jgi:hypothetical protein